MRDVGARLGHLIVIYSDLQTYFFIYVSENSRSTISKLIDVKMEPGLHMGPADGCFREFKFC